MDTTGGTRSPARGALFWLRATVRFVIYLLLVPAALFLSAGRLDWVMGWVVFGVMLCASLLSRALVARLNPDLLRERAAAGEREGVQPWDRWLVPAVALLGPAAMAVVAGLDQRQGWSAALPWTVAASGLGLLLLGDALSTWAMVSNPFFSAYVRIQSDRGHVAVSRGPYRWLRHPGYAGAVLADFAVPLALGSLWAMVPAVATIALVALRTALEDRTLRALLPGYREYAQRVRFRLIPRVW